MKIISGGITAPEGYTASGISCGIKKGGGRDLALLVSDTTASAAGVFTLNSVKGNSLKLTMEHIHKGSARAVVINSGNANACNGPNGYDNAHSLCQKTASLLHCPKDEILFNSTGVIGFPLSMDKLLPGLDSAYNNLSRDGAGDCAQAIMTTDTFQKEIAVELELHKKKVRIGGMAKGSGMIHPDMATMISVLTTDVSMDHVLLKESLKKSCDRSFNRISVDGDTSVCDMVVILANGRADSQKIERNTSSYARFMQALEYVCEELAKSIARDGEGATKLLEICCTGAKTASDAHKVINSVARSPLVKTMFFGMDANPGRIITAVGYSTADIEPSRIDIFIGDLQFYKAGNALPFSEKDAKDVLMQKEIKVVIDLNMGQYQDRIWTCDLSYDYVKINGSYRT